MASERRDLDARLRKHQADLVRLDRLQGALDERDKRLQEQAKDFEAKLARLQTDSAELEEQVVQLDDLRTNLQQEAELLAKQRKDHDVLAADLGQRCAAVEGQQATLAALRTRLERTREEVRAHEQQIERERMRQEAA